MVYQWKEGTRYKTDANIAGAVCARMEAAGTLTAGNLVEASRPEDAPLHKEFEWDNSIAAEEWRKYQARNIIHSLVLVADESETESVRAFFKIEAKASNYESIVSIVQEEDKYAALLKTALRELAAFQKKYSQIKEFAALFAEIENLEAK